MSELTLIITIIGLLAIFVEYYNNKAKSKQEQKAKLQLILHLGNRITEAQDNLTKLKSDFCLLAEKHDALVQEFVLGTKLGKIKREEVK